jgi:hypothetical protein
MPVALELLPPLVPLLVQAESPTASSAASPATAIRSRRVFRNINCAPDLLVRWPLPGA